MKAIYISLLMLVIPLYIHAMPSEKTNVDSICEYLSGTWFAIYSYGGIVGGTTQLYSSDSVNIERIPNTDSLLWRKKSNGVWRNYMKVLISPPVADEADWVLTHSAGSKSHLYIEDYGFSWFQVDVSDAGGTGYSRNKRTVAIDEIKDKTNIIESFPNPTKGIVQLSGDNNGNIQILDATGKVLKHIIALKSIKSVDLSVYTKGIYFLRVISKGKPTLLKVIKE